MSRLFDKVMGESFRVRNAATDAAAVWAARDVIRHERKVLEITNVVRYYAGQENMDAWTLDDFSTCAPPFTNYWMEWQTPAWRFLLQGSSGDGRVLEGLTVPSRRCAVSIDAERFETRTGWHLRIIAFGEDGKRVVGPLAMWSVGIRADGGLEFNVSPAVTEAFTGAVLEHGADPNLEVLEDLERGVEEDSIVTTTEDLIPGRLTEEAELITPLGRKVIGQIQDNSHFWDGWTPEMMERAPNPQMGELIVDVGNANERIRHSRQTYREVLANVYRWTFLQPALLAHSFLSCKNVTLDEHAPPVVRKQKRGRTPAVRFYTLRINPMGGRRAPTEAPASIDLGGGARALHIVRGHFKTYTPERPLLGRHVGRYYWAQNLRGKAEAGVIVKDYEMGEVTVPGGDA